MINDNTKYAITGGIGSGKSYVCKQLAAFGITVYDCDDAAKRLLRSSKQLQEQLVSLVGKELYIDNVLQKGVLAQYILQSDAHAQQVDDIIHPAVAADFNASGLQWLESAIFFDSGFNRRVSIDRVICVTAPIETRIDRIMKRDGITRAKAIEWIERQLPQEEVVRLSDFEIVNDGKADVVEQIKRILNITNNKN
jgi:dephospho-CoA kinase